MERVGNPGFVIGRRATVVVAALAVWIAGVCAGAPWTSAANAQPTADPEIQAQEVRTVWTSEFGVDRPAGLAYDPSRREFLVAGDAATGTSVLRLGPDEERLGASRLPRLADPSTLAFDEARDELTAIDRGEQVEVSGDDLDSARPQVERAPVTGPDLDAPSSATFDPDSDTWFVLEDDEVAMVPGDDLSSAPERLELAPSDAERLIAFNTADNLLYVMDQDKDLIEAVNRDGEVEKTFGLASVELSDPVAMTFAPSTDPTDDAAIQNLYVADAGSDDTLGGVTELSLAAVAALIAPVDTATHVQTIATSAWNPASPDPAGIVWMPAVDELAVVDSEVDEQTGAGWHDVNFWRSTRTGSVVGTGALWGPNSAGSYSREPTGLGFDAGSTTLFISDDSARRIFVVKRGPDNVFGTTDDVVTSINTQVIGSTDSEDPEYDPVSGHLFFLDGVGREIYRINPVDGIFGNGNDVTTSFDISHLGPTDFEGLTSNPERRTLYVGARTTEEIFEITHDGTLVRTIDASAVSGLMFISGLAVAPASNGTGQMNLWIVDRAVDNGPNPNENDGRIFEISAPDIGGPPAQLPPVAVNDSATTTPDTAVTVAVLDNDADPNGDPMTVTNLTQPANGTAQLNPNQSVTYTPNAGFTGTDSFTYTANDGQADSNVATVTVTVLEEPPASGAPVFRSASSAIVTGASGTTLTIERPAGVEPGDLLLAQIRHRSTGTLTPPAGWTHIGTITRTAASHGVYYKIAGGSEPLSYVFNQGDNAGRMAGGIGAYSGVSLTDPIDAWAASAVDTATLVAPSATSTVPNTMVVRLWGWRSPSATDAGVGFNAPPAGVDQRWSEQAGHSNNDRNRVLAGDQVRATAGAVGTSTASGSTSSEENRRSAFTVILKPAGDGGGDPTNQPPVAVNDSASTTPDTAVNIPVLDNDSDAENDPLTVTNLTQPANGSAQLNPNNTVMYTPDAEFVGTDTFTYTANDGQADSNLATVSVTVAPEDPPPGGAPVFRSASSSIVTGASGTTLTIARPAGVEAGDLLLAQIRHRSTGTLTPPAGWTHIGTITRTAASHGVYYKIAGASEPASHAFNQGDNAGRMAGGIGAYIGVSATNPIDAWAASAVDTATLIAPAATSTVDNAMVVRLWGWRSPSATDAGVGFNAPPAGVTERWSEQVDHSNNDRNRVLAGEHVQATAGPVGTSTASGSASSQENRRSSFTVILRPAGGSSGGGGGPSNQPPVAVDDSASTAAGTAVTVPVLDNDSDPDDDPLTVTNLTQPANGSAQVNPNNTVTYTPDAGFTGTDTLTYTANDGQADSNVATVSVTVASEDPPPGGAPEFRSASSASVTGSGGTTLTIARPAEVEAGDLLLAQVRYRSANVTAPAGWTLVGTITQSVAHHGVYYKIAGASEPASYVFTQSSNQGRMAGGIGAYTGVSAANPIDAWAASAGTTSTLVAPGATSTVDNTRVVRLWGWRGASGSNGSVGFNTPPAGVAERWSEQTGSNNTDRNRVLAGDHVQATAGAVGTSTASGATNSQLNSRNAFTVILRPAGG